MSGTITIRKGLDLPISGAFDNDCREGICGMCGLYINGRPHGNDDGINDSDSEA